MNTMKAIIAIALAAALFLYGAPASADEPGQEGLNLEATQAEFVPAPRDARATIIESTVYDLDESRPEVRD